MDVIRDVRIHLQGFGVLTEDKRKLVILLNLDLSQVAYVAVRFHKQKNDVNNKVVPFYRDTANLAFCPVGTALRICARALRLGVAGDIPLGVYRSAAKRMAGLRLFITNSDVKNPPGICTPSVWPQARQHHPLAMVGVLHLSHSMQPVAPPRFLGQLHPDMTVLEG